MSRFAKIQHEPRRLADEVYQQLLDGIVNGEIAPGGRLIQESLAAEMAVSRTPIREALLRLEREGVIEPAERRGFLVVDLSAEALRDIFQARQAVEGFAARLVAERASAEAISRLRPILHKEMSFAGVGDVYDEKRRIHRAVVEATGNPAMLELFDSLWGRGRVLRMMADVAISDEILTLWRRSHVELHQAIERRDGDLAESIMVAHIQHCLELQVAAVRTE